MIAENNNVLLKIYDNTEKMFIFGNDPIYLTVNLNTYLGVVTTKATRTLLACTIIS